MFFPAIFIINTLFRIFHVTYFHLSYNIYFYYLVIIIIIINSYFISYANRYHIVLISSKKKLFSFYKCASHALKLEGKTMQLNTHVKVAAEVVQLSFQRCSSGTCRSIAELPPINPKNMEQDNW